MLKSLYLCANVLIGALACVQDPIQTYLPIPDEAKGPALNSDGYRIEDFGKGAYMITNNQYQALALVSTEGVIVVDAPPSVGLNLLPAIRNITHLPITHQVYSHSHTDHIGASYLYGTNITRIAHRMTAEFLKLTPDPNRPLPDVTFSEEKVLTVGNQTLQLKYNGPNHSPDNIYIYAPAQKVLMLIDIIFPGWVPYAYLGKAEDIPGYIQAHTYALEYDFDHLVAGHLTRSGNRKDVENSLGYVTDLEANCREAYRLGVSPPNSTNNLTAANLGAAALAANPGNPFAALTTIINAFSNYCNDKTNKKWAGVLAATDLYGFSHAYTIADDLRIEEDAFGPFSVEFS